MNRLLLPLLLVVATVAAGCATKPADPTTAGNSTNSTTGGNMTAQAFTVTVGGGACPPNAPPVSPGSTDYYTLSPKKLSFTVGQKVNLTLKNAGCAGHDLTIQGIDGAAIKQIAGGASASVEFTATKAGTFPMYCTLGSGPTAPATSHKDHGMSGSVEVK